MTRRHTWWCAAALVAFSVGCAEDIPTTELGKLAELAPKPKQEEQTPPEDPSSAPGAADSSEPDPAQTEPDGTEQATAAPSAGGGYGAYGGGVASKDETYGQGAPIKLKSEVDNPDLAKAEGGVGRRGQGYGGGIITEPIRQRFILQDRITFLNMLNTLKVYRAENNDKNPPTIQEFVDQIVTASGVMLPELPPGHFYVYDPSARQLEDVLLVDQSQPQ